MLTARYVLEESGDYLQIRCALDEERCTMEFVGYDPAVARVEVSCPKCGKLGPIKLDGFRIKPKRRRPRRNRPSLPLPPSRPDESGDDHQP